VPGDAEELREIYGGRFWGHLGIEFVEASDGRCVCRIAIREHHTNYNGVVHGGVISSLIDSTAGGAVRTLRSPAEIAARPHATSDLHVQYLAGARGTELVAEAHIVKAGRTAIFVDVVVRDGTQRAVARGSATFVVSQGRPAAEEG
jgi:uncharacterized protein (TIGR00369 family)